MWWLIALAAFILVPLMYLLFAPIYLEVDSREGLCRLRLHRLASAGIFMEQGTLIAEFKFGYLRKRIDLIQKIISSKKQPVTKDAQPTRKPTGRKPKLSMRQVAALLRSFSVNRFLLTTDTGNMPLNGMLYPWVYIISKRTGLDMSVNFTGENVLVLQIENNIARMLWAFIANK